MEATTTEKFCTETNKDKYIQRCECSTFWVIEKTHDIFTPKDLSDWWVPSALNSVTFKNVLELVEDHLGDSDVFALTKAVDQLFDPTPRQGGFVVLGSRVVFTNCLKIIQEQQVIEYRRELAQRESEQRELDRQRRNEANQRWNEYWIQAGRSNNSEG